MLIRLRKLLHFMFHCANRYDHWHTACQRYWNFLRKFQFFTTATLLFVISASIFASITLWHYRTIIAHYQTAMVVPIVDTSDCVRQPISLLFGKQQSNMANHTENMKPLMSSAGMTVRHDIIMVKQYLLDTTVQRQVSPTSFTQKKINAHSQTSIIKQSQVCHQFFLWPVAHTGEKPAIEQHFHLPPKPWMAGNRGVDIVAKEGDPLIAPYDGIIAFRGEVANKQVVTIRHNDMLTSTFEPATTNLSAGTHVQRGEEFAQVAQRSDHCDQHCIHWGIKDKQHNTYRNPEELTRPMRIVLLPTTS